MVFRLDAQQYALALEVVERVLPMIRWSPLPQAPAIVLGVVNLHGAILPVVDIRRRFGRAPRDYGDGGHLLIARAGHRRLALPVDEALGTRDVNVRDVAPAGSLPPGVGYVTGVLPIAGGVLFIHDLGDFLSLDEARALDAGLPGAP